MLSASTGLLFLCNWILSTRLMLDHLFVKSEQDTMYVTVMDLAWDTFMERYLTTVDSPILTIFFSKTEARIQGHSDS